MRRRSFHGAILAVWLLAALPIAAAVVDETPPVGSVSVVHDDRDNQLIRLRVPATDGQSGVTTVEVSGNGTTWASFPYAAEVDWAVFDPASGGDPDVGNRTIRVRWTDGVGNTSLPVTTTLYLSANGALEYRHPPVTGSSFTIRPIYAPGVVPPADDWCSWELRWGDNDALKLNEFNETFGSLLVSGKPALGFCGQWTFTIPWVPIAQFEVYFSSGVMATDDDSTRLPARFYPAAASTDRRIRSSNLPLVQVLPDSYNLVVGVPITYRAFPIGVALHPDDIWTASRIAPTFYPYKLKHGGSTFTFTPNAPGSWLVGWTGHHNSNMNLGATYDPKARYPDRYPPNTTPPVARLGTGPMSDRIPVTLEWSGSDRGWGIEKYKLQRSVDGGAWQTLSLPTPKARSLPVLLAPGHRYLYRVRAKDKYGNVGLWDYGPVLRPRLFGDTHPAITYTSPWSLVDDATALGGALHEASAPIAYARFSFEGRAIAWVAETGPGKGRAKVYVDGSLLATIDLGGASDVSRRLVFRRHWSSVGTHKLKIVVEGTLGRPTVTLDGFAVLK